MLVIGAGVVGLSIAYHIKENKPHLSVLLIDRYPATGQGDTAKSMAALRDTFTSDVNRQLARSTINFYKHVQTEVGFNLNLDMVGYLWLMTERQFIAYESIANQMRTQGIRLKVVEHDELTSLMPDLVLDPASEQSKILGLESIHKAVFGLDCGIVAPELIVKFYENEFRKLGGEFQFGTEAKALHLGAGKPLGLPGEPFAWQDKFFKEVETSQGAIVADTIVLATGIRTATLLDPLGVDCLTKPQKNQVYQVRGENIQRLLKTKGFNEQGTVPFTILPRGEAYFRPNPGERSFWLSSTAGIGQAFKLEEEPIAEREQLHVQHLPHLERIFSLLRKLAAGQFVGRFLRR